MQIRILIIAVAFLITASHQTCQTTDAHGLPSCAINAALDAGSTIGLLQSCQYDICCWCNDTNFTSQLNETWKGCSEADRDQAYQFFQSECDAQNPPNTTSSLNHTASSSPIIRPLVSASTGARLSSLSTTLSAASSSSSQTVPTSLSSSSLSSTSTPSASATHTSQAATGRKMYNNLIKIVFVMVAVSYLGL